MGCFNSKQTNSYDQSRTINYQSMNQTQKKKVSDIIIGSPEQQDIFQRIQSPLDNESTMTKTYKQIPVNQLKVEVQNLCRNQEWRKVTCPQLNSQNSIVSATGICAWQSMDQKVMDGKGLLYVQGRNDQYLLCGGFYRGSIIMGDKYIKVLRNNSYYIGELNNQVSPHGLGEVYYKNILQHKGHFKNGMPNGEGQKYEKDRTYIGNFLNGEIVYGRYITPRGQYQGQFKNNLRHGSGILTTKSGLRYQGSFKGNKRQGFGTGFNERGEIVAQGEWKNDKFVGTQDASSNQRLAKLASLENF